MEDWKLLVQSGKALFERFAKRLNAFTVDGVSEFKAAVAAGSPTGFWRMSGHPAVQAALRNHHFDSLGLPRLYVPHPA
jgi:hypothetical protein